MFMLEVNATFSAAHAIVIRGERERLHGHDWHVTATIEGPELDGDGLLVDFHAVDAALVAIVSPFHNANLNETPPFDRVNPTAEAVARHIAESLQRRLESGGPQGPKIQGSAAVRVASVRVTEAVGCAATYRASAGR